jgi:hypothetical protein
VAKLRARKRVEVFRVERTIAHGRDGVAEASDFRALMSDGNVLERRVLRYTPEEVAKNYGRKSHDYGWKVRGRAKAGLTLEQLLRGYLDRGWQLADASDDYFTVSGDSIEAHSPEPFVSVEKAERRREGLAKSAARRGDRRKAGDGPGLYVTNGFTGSAYRTRVADHPGPFPSYEQAEEFALGRFRHLMGLSLDYLLPVLVIQANSRHEAEAGSGDVLWADGKATGPAVDPRQTSLF